VSAEAAEIAALLAWALLAVVEAIGAVVEVRATGAANGNS
jgi:hypothetical protein